MESEQPISEQPDQPASLKERLMKRSAEIRGAVEAELITLEKPTIISELSRKLKSNRMTVEKYVLLIIEEGKVPVSVVRIGGYDVIYKVCKDKTCQCKAQAEAVGETGTETKNENEV